MAILESFKSGKGEGAFAAPNPETEPGAPIQCVALIKGYQPPDWDYGISSSKINLFKIIARLPKQRNSLALD